ncbi:MAG: cation:proton antiporter, partial [Hyphomonas sp. 34-62-18]
MGACACAGIDRGNLISVLTAAVSFYLAIVTLGLVQSSPTGILSYEIGRWPPPIGIEFRTDALNAMILLLVTGIGFLASVFSWPTITSELGNRNKLGMFYAAFLLCMAGLLGVASTGDAFNLFVFLEISSLATYVLVAMGARRDRRALPAAFNYLIMGTLGASFYIIGIGFLYAATGT